MTATAPAPADPPTDPRTPFAGPAATPAPTEPTAPREPLGRRFHALLASTTLANLADGVVQAAVPLYALTLTRSPGQIALLSAAAWLPHLLLGLAAGVLVDRTDRRRAQVVALAARAVLLLAAAGLALTDRMTVPVLLAVVLAYGVTDVLADLAQNALVPDLVPRSRLHTANGRVMAAQQVAGSFLGGPIGGFVLGAGAAWAFGLPAGLAVAAAVVLLRGVPGRYRHATTEPSDASPADPPAPRPGLLAAAGRESRRALAEVREGVAFLVHHRVLRPLLITGSVSNMCFTGYTAVFVLWAVGDGSAIGLTATQYPLLGVAMAVGAVLGSLVVEPLHRLVGEIRLMLGSWLAMAVLLLVPVLWPTPAATAGAFAVIGLLSTLGNVLSQSLRQRLVRPQMLGRVGGAGRTLAYGLMPLGALLAGAAAEAWGLTATLTGTAVVAVLALIYPLLVVRQRHVTAAEQHVPA